MAESWRSLDEERQVRVQAQSDPRDLAFSDLLPFLLIAFGLAWGLAVLLVLSGEWLIEVFGELRASHPLFILAVYSPAIGTIAIVLWRSGAGGLMRYLSRLLLWRCSFGWYAFLMFGIPLIYFTAAAVQGSYTSVPFTTLGSLLAAMGFMLVLGPVEELGWRGLALPLLQRRLAPFWAGLILGLIWGIWHLPAFFLGGTPQSAWGFTPFLIGSVAVSIILTPLFNRSGGSILLAVLYHFQLNNPLWPDAQPYDLPFFVAAAVLTVWLHRDTMFERGGVTEVVPATTSPPTTSPQ
jgi:uncharacterized protein